MDHKTQKVDITNGYSYNSSSTNDIMELRIMDRTSAAAKADANIFVKLQSEEPTRIGYGFLDTTMVYKNYNF